MTGPDSNTILREFASQFGGGLLPSFEELTGTEDPLSSAALKFTAELLAQFEGQANGDGLEFKYAIGFLDDMVPNAVCSHYGGQFCIGVTVGMHGKIFEISAALVRAFWGKEAAAFNDGALENLGFKTLPRILEGKEQHYKLLIDTVDLLRREGLSKEFVYINNILLLFIILHEVRHATDGHALLISSLEPLAYMEESPSGLSSINRGVRNYCEFCADSDAVITILANISEGRTFFDFDRPFDELFQAVWLGSMLLANTWADLEEATTHPLATDRIINLWQCGFRIMTGGERFVTPEKARIVGAIVDRLAVLHPSFRRLAMAISDDGEQRYRDTVREVSSDKSIRFASLVMERLSFTPIGMTIVR